MGAQSAHEPSMEDILASIRKIISEDSNEEVSAESAAAPHIAPTQQKEVPSVPPLALENEPPQSPVLKSGEPPVLQARRELFEQSEKGFSAPEQPPMFATPDPTLSGTATRPAVNNTPLKSYRDQPASVLAAPKSDKADSSGGYMGGHGHHYGNTDINEPLTEPHQEQAAPTTNNTSGGHSASASSPLHPAIENAKAFVANRQQQPSTPMSSPEKPVFSQSQLSEQSSVSNAKIKPMISPESLERREEPDRRNHPLRRGDDREEREFKNALTSPQSAFSNSPERAPAQNQPNQPIAQDTIPAPVLAQNTLMSEQTGDAVSNALDQLKNSAMDGLDGKVEALLRPMLREWLDNNLPSMVERLVRDEIERVSRGS